MTPSTLLVAALALRSTDALTLSLTGGGQVTGTFVRAEPTVVVVRTPEGQVEVPRVLVEQVALNGAPWTVEALAGELDEAVAARAALLADPPWAPAPALTAGLSLLWSGAGHAALGEPRTAAGYAAADAVLIGAGALSLAIPENRGTALTIFALDLLLRGYAAADAAQLAGARRAMLRQE